MQQTFTVKKSDGTTNVVYSLRSANGNSAEYVDATSSPSAPRLAKISHALKPIGSRGSDRHSILFQTVVLDAEGLPHIVSTSVTITVPRAAVVTDTIVKDVIAATTGYLALAGVVDATIDGITL